ncbi:TIGR01212 family radical SAM protein [Bacteroidales bacterium OttesenSCG-928-B11]|nr:TIGR01212 family radical SAM protein [Bacteroidales bacterium OttesenSCG-928-E04]MDL2308222.1 TIGR01212 family radical SAM protein [Bacteroidales bacterium OttesenSCG-928-C03]MDL2311522.1 TIGR01212 family radical SAM protein [Bacteroidales bacterium OttesenSCG-928-B11]MDL2325661.1 TIGR01212 family radical SAM protein [Bacteroidales bacterium OttesenSCG-928-A14]
MSNRRYNSYKNFLLKRFGGRIQKLTIDAGFSCPNRDGAISSGGCSFCLNDAFNPSYCTPEKSVVQQLTEGIEFHANRYRRAEGYLAYFQAFSNTYAPLSKLKEVYAPALANPLIKGIVVGTRPDCMDKEKLAYFKSLNENIFVSIEYGVESTEDRTLQRINRGHDFQCAADMIAATAEAGIHTGAHFIFGLPGENPDLWFNNIHKINNLAINSVKFHQLQIIKDRPIEREFYEKRDDFYLFDINNYIDFITEYITYLNPNFIIERFAGEVPPRYLAFSHWGTTRYDVVLQQIEKRLEEKDNFQGKRFSSPIDIHSK